MPESFDAFVPARIRIAFGIVSFRFIFPAFTGGLTGHDLIGRNRG